MLELIAPMVGGVEGSDGSWIEAKQKLDGGPSVLYDAIAILASPEAASALARMPAARDFVADAFAHVNFVAYTESALPLFAKAGLTENLDMGFVALVDAADAARFVKTCAPLRFWERDAEIRQI